MHNYNLSFLIRWDNFHKKDLKALKDTYIQKEFPCTLFIVSGLIFILISLSKPKWL